MKNLPLSFALALGSILTAQSAFAAQLPGAAGFPDVPNSHPNADAINYLRSRGIVQGNPDGNFLPDTRINRAEFVRIVASPAVLQNDRVQDCIRENISENTTYVFFKDVPREEWYAPYVCLTKIKKMVDGYPDNTFKPTNYISFVEATKILVSQFSGSYSDPALWYKPYVEKMAEYNAIPTSIDTFSQTITRGEMAEMLYRLMAEKRDLSSHQYGDIK